MDEEAKIRHTKVLNLEYMLKVAMKDAAIIGGELVAAQACAGTLKRAVALVTAIRKAEEAAADLSYRMDDGESTVTIIQRGDV